MLNFTDETAACMVVSDDIFVMLLTNPKFKSFTPKEICDATKSTEVLVCLTAEGRQKVDALVRKAITAGARPIRNRNITALCTDMDFRTWMAISGNWSIWSPAQSSNPEAYLASTGRSS